MQWLESGERLQESSGTYKKKIDGGINRKRVYCEGQDQCKVGFTYVTCRDTASNISAGYCGAIPRSNLTRSSTRLSHLPMRRRERISVRTIPTFGALFSFPGAGGFRRAFILKSVAFLVFAVAYFPRLLRCFFARKGIKNEHRSS
jgi:hypothetical protein